MISSSIGVVCVLDVCASAVVAVVKPVIQEVVLRFRSRPIATVWRGVQRLGKTPYLLKGKPGEYYVLKLRAKGFRTQTIKGTLSDKLQQQKLVTLRSRTATKRVKSKSRKTRSKGPFDIEDPI